MLRGTIHVKDKNLDFDIKGNDTSTTLSLEVSGRQYNAISYMSNNECNEDDDALWERRFDIGMAKIKVATKVTLVEGKKKKASVNADLFCKIAALIRYAKQNCFRKYQTDYMGLVNSSGDFDEKPETEYNIPFPCDTTTIFANVKLVYDCLKELHIETDEFKIDLVEKSSEAEYMESIVDGWQSGIAFNEDYLGFELPPQVVNPNVTRSGIYKSIEDIIAAHPEKEFSWLLQKDYILVTDDRLEEICKYIMEWDGYVYYDTETTGLNINFKSRIGQADQLVGVVLSVKYGESFFFPTQMKSIPNLCGGDHFFFMEHYMRPILEGKELVAHNMSFDWKVAYIYDINANIVHDTMALIKLTVGAERENFPMSLKELAKILLGRDSLELSDLLTDSSWGDTDIKFWDLPAESVRLYACADTDNTNGLLQYAIQSDLLNKYNATKVYDIEIAFSFAVAYQEFFGHRIDVLHLEQIRQELGVEQERLLKEMEDIAGHPFNPNSSKQLIDIMYNELGIPAQYSRTTKKLTTDKETIKKLAELKDIEDNIKYPFCEKLLEYRQYEGVRKIVDKFPEHMTEDGYIFSSVMQYGTTTGRVSINSPNYQSYNDPIKKNVIPRPGFWMFDTDYSSVEYRVLGNMVGNKRIMDSFEDPDFDYHAYQAAHMYGVPYSAVTKKLRKAAKGINFGLPYGMGDESLGVRVFGEASDENTRKARELRQAYFKGQEDIRDWFEYHRDRGVNEGFTETYFGRRRYYYKSKFTDAKIRRQAGNQVIQGTAADIYKTAVGRVFKRICREGWLGKVIFTGFIHDELLGEVSNEINPGVFLKMLREEFEVKITNPDGTPWCPLYMGFGYGMSWYEAKSVELPIKLQWEFVEKYGETGFPEWQGDGRAFCDTIPDKLRDFDVRDIRNQLLDEESQGQEIKPTLNNQVIDCIKTDSKYYKKCIEEYAETMGWNLEGIEEKSSWLFNNKDDIIKDMDSKYHIQNLYYEDVDENGYPIYLIEFEPKKTTQDAITQYCILHNVDRTKVNLLDIEEVDTSEKTEKGLGIDFDAEDEEASENFTQELIDTRIDTLGLYLDITNKMIILKLPNDVRYMDIIKGKVNREGKGYKVRFKDSKNCKLWDTDTYIESQDINFIQELYLQYFKNGGQ